MTPTPDPDSFLSYVSGVADASETEFIETWLASGSPAAAARYAEALAVFNAVPLGLVPVEPPDAVRHAVFGRVTADAGNGPGSFGSVGRTLRWPVYASTALAACLAVALTASLWKNGELSGRAKDLTATVAQMQTLQNQQPMAAAGLRQLIASPHLSMASLTPQPQTPPSPAKPAGRVLYCPVTQLYQVSIFSLPPLPTGRAYQLWLISPKGEAIPREVFTQDGQGVATLMTHPNFVTGAAGVAVSDEPAGGSPTGSPTGPICLQGRLQPNR